MYQVLFDLLNTNQQLEDKRFVEQICDNNSLKRRYDRKPCKGEEEIRYSWIKWVVIVTRMKCSANTESNCDTLLDSYDLIACKHNIRSTREKCWTTFRGNRRRTNSQPRIYFDIRTSTEFDKGGILVHCAILPDQLPRKDEPTKIL
jgi:hypothetical protein